MASCTFFGHRECLERVRRALREVLKTLICEHGVTEFYVGNQGSFDLNVQFVLKELKENYPQINYWIVLAYMPNKPDNFSDYTMTILPEGIENVNPRYAISWRNRWMLKRSENVVTYITHSWGGAAQFAEQAVRQKKRVINIANETEK